MRTRKTGTLPEAVSKPSSRTGLRSSGWEELRARYGEEARLRGVNVVKRSKIFDLPKGVANELIGRVIAQQFTDYKGHARWLRGKGFRVGQSTIHRTLSPYQRYLPLIKRAEFLRRATGGALNLREALEVITMQDMADALTALIQSARGRRG